MKKILVIDDEEWLREMVQLALEQKGYDVIEAESGETGIEKARKLLPDLVLCDVNMEKMNGYKTLSMLRSDPTTAAIPFILMTGLADNAGMRHGMELGADDYLPKPFALDALYAAVEARLKKSQMIREEAEKKLADLRDNISMMLPHELRTPLNGILAYGEILTADAASLQPTEIAEMGQVIYQSGKRLERLIENFLIYSQIELLGADAQKKHSLRGEQTMNPGKLIEEHSRKEAREVNRDADLRLKVSDMAVPMSADYLSKVTDELVQNAFKFSDPGSPVLVELIETAEAVVLAISDHGKGFSNEQVNKVGAYMQFDRKMQEQQGLGLGLSIARRLTELHGGTLAIKSEKGKGTTITVTIPRNFST